MITETKTVYKCEHCRKMYQRKHFCEKHEKACWKNPENKRACFDCKHLRKENWTEEGQYHDATYSLFYCDKIENYLKTPQTEAKGNAFETEPENVPMKKQCPYFKSALIHDMLSPFEPAPGTEPF